MVFSNKINALTKLGLSETRRRLLKRFSDNFQMYILKVFKETCDLVFSIIFKVKIILFNPIEMVVKICLFDEEKDRNF